MMRTIEEINAELASEHAAFFAREHRGLIYGNFQSVTSAMVSDAMVRREILAHRLGSSGPIAACALFRRARQRASIRDFAGRALEIPAGAIRVDEIAASSASAGAGLLAQLLRCWPRGLWIEAYEEDEPMHEALSRQPALRYVATRIAAGSEIKGIYTNAWAASGWRYEPAEMVSLAILDPAFASPAELDEALEEIEAGASWAQHYSSYNKRHSWTGFALRGYDRRDPLFIIKPAEMAKSWRDDPANERYLGAREAQWTDAARAFPRVLEFAQRIAAGRKVDRVRLMRLAPGGELGRHADITDREAGLADGRLARLHLPLRTSPKVTMHGWDKRGRHQAMHWPAGALCYLDQRGPHRVQNEDAQCERVHLIMDVCADARLREMIAGGHGRA